MTDVEAEQIVVWYSHLESQLETFLKTVPLSYENQDVHLPLLAPLIVEAGSLIDTIFREEYQAQLSQQKLSIKDFALHFERQHKFSEVKSLLFQHPPRYLAPFAGWTSAKTGNYVERKWWTTYNYLKHNRIKKYNLATLGETTAIVCALQQVIAILPTFTQTLWRHNFLYAGPNMPTFYVGQPVEESYIRNHGVVETELFSTPVGEEKFPSKVEEIIPYWFGGKRLGRFLGRA